MVSLQFDVTSEGRDFIRIYVEDNLSWILAFSVLCESQCLVTLACCREQISMDTALRGIQRSL